MMLLITARPARLGELTMPEGEEKCPNSIYIGTHHPTKRSLRQQFKAATTQPQKGPSHKFINGVMQFHEAVAI
jgi:hypothetical protein